MDYSRFIQKFRKDNETEQLQRQKELEEKLKQEEENKNPPKLDIP